MMYPTFAFDRIRYNQPSNSPSMVQREHDQIDHATAEPNPYVKGNGIPDPNRNSQNTQEKKNPINQQSGNVVPNVDEILEESNNNGMRKRSNQQRQHLFSIIKEHAEILRRMKLTGNSTDFYQLSIFAISQLLRYYRTDDCVQKCTT